METNTRNRARNNCGAAVVVSLMLLLSFGTFAQKVQLALTESFEAGNWRNYAQTTNTFDTAERQLATLVQLWESNAWRNNLQTLYTNNSVDGTVTTAVNQVWNAAVNDWENSERTTYTYNGAGKVLTEVTESWAGNNWRYVSRETNKYEIGGALVQSLVQHFDPSVSKWINASQKIYTNNINGTVNQVLQLKWNDITGSWNNFELTAFTYNASDKVLTATAQRWVSGSWTNKTRETNSYDGNGFLISAATQVWDTRHAGWQNDMRYDYTNNTDGTIAQSVTQSWNNGGWSNELRFTFNYEASTATGVGADGFSVFPNPARDVITLSADGAVSGIDYTIADQTGRPFLSGTLTSSQTNIDVQPLDTGVYYIQIGPQKEHMIKMIKE